MTAEIEFRGLFRATAFDSMTPGAWYLGFRCQACHETFAVLDDPSGTGEVEAMGKGMFETLCPTCGAANRYTADDMIVFEAATAQATQGTAGR